MPTTSIHQNPLSRLRRSLGLSQLELATRAGLTRQTVTDVESGLYLTVPPSLLSYVSQASGIQPNELRLRYVEWIETCRNQNSHNFLRVDWGDVGTFRELCMAVGGSIKGFCRVTCIQRSIIVEYIASGHRSEYISRALLDCSLSPGAIQHIMKLPRE